MIIQNKIIKYSVILLAVFAICAGIWKMNSGKQDTLSLGIFIGSDWKDVNTNTYMIVDEAIRKFEEKNGNIKVMYIAGIRRSDYSEWLAQKALEGELPDVFMILPEDFNRYVSLGLMQNLDDYIQNDKEFDTGRYYSGAYDAGKVKGKVYGLPYEVVPTLMFVNRTLLEQEGFSVPSTTWTWEDLYEIAGEITVDKTGDGVPDQFCTFNYTWEDALHSNGISLFTEDGKDTFVDDARMIEVVEFLKKLHELNKGKNVTQDDFDAGNVAFMPLSFVEYRTYKTYPYRIKKYTNFHWDCITMPAGPNGGNISGMDVFLMGISSAGKNKNKAWELLKAFTHDNRIQMNIYSSSQGASALRDVTDSNEAEYLLQKNMEADEKVIDMGVLGMVIDQGVTSAEFPKYDEAMVLTDSQINAILAEDLNVDSTLKKYKRNLKMLLNR